jgi:hypothetical protein
MLRKLGVKKALRFLSDGIMILYHLGYAGHISRIEYFPKTS